jgi:hypothetical protein
MAEQSGGEETTEWYWDLERHRAVPAAERGPGDHMLGPYRTKGEAENWKATSERRNQSWDDDDREWRDAPWGDERDRD